MAAIGYNGWLSTGLPGQDAMLHGLRPGDNVVYRVESTEDYRPLVRAYAEDALRQRRTLIYFRFARHAALVPEQPGIRRVTVHPEVGFERFLTEIIDEIEAAGHGAYYIFDCLSDLAVDWYSDRMLANFFMITCPYLYELDTVAYFALLRHHHSAYAIDGIHNTAQVIMDVYHNREQTYVQPLKVYERYSPTMFLVHHWQGQEFTPVTSSAILSEIFSETPQLWLDFSVNRPGVWTKTFLEAQEVLEQYRRGEGDDAAVERCADRLRRMAVTRDARLLQLAETYFSLADLVGVMKRMIGTGLIGGKSLGMLLARAIVEKSGDDLAEVLEAHDSFYVGSDVFYTYIVRNGCWWLRRRRPNEDFDDYLERAESARLKMLHGMFPEDIQSQFAEMLDYFGQSPVIVRSSSLLEDNYGNAFSGKYDSVFCANQGTPRERLQQFIEAVRAVYASTLNREALIYRHQRGLMDRDEQMALLVQRVSGAAYGDHFFPHLAGVGYSFNSYVWSPEIEPAAGLVRLVCGLGTRAVDRTDDDYTRLIALNAPDRTPHSGDDASRYSQRRLDALQLPRNELVELSFESVAENDLGDVLPLLASEDGALLRRARQQGMKNIFPWVLDFDGLLHRTEFIPAMRRMLRLLRDAYNYEVDVEFTTNFFRDGRFLINLVQCRPFQVRITDETAARSLACREDTQGTELLSSRGPIIGASLATRVDRLIHVVPGTYSLLPEQKRYEVARLIGTFTHDAGADGRTIMLVGPGRWGTSTPSLGVPVTFGQINTVSIICEVALMHEGLVPDISLGTHFFNDLVELEMLYLAVSPGQEGHQLDLEALAALPNQLPELLPERAGFADVVRVVDHEQLADGASLELHADTMRQRATLHQVPNS